MSSHPAQDENQRIHTVNKPANIERVPTTAPRRALGDRSPNVKSAHDAAPIATLLKKKAVASSPLKRSFTAMAGNESGFSYLKSRRLSRDQALSDVEVTRSASRSVFSNSEQRLDHDALCGVAEVALEAPGVPVIQELSPTESNTPSDSEDAMSHSSTERKSFSSLINYDPLSQTSYMTVGSTSQAQKLKLRLRVAMYKVRTNQIDVPFHQLEVDEGLCRGRASSKAVEAAVAELRREAQARLPLHRDPVPKLLPAPLLLPTAHSSRIISWSALPSSPPLLTDAHRDMPPGQAASDQDFQDFSILPRSPERRLLQSEAELTTSVVKGRVAEGLLGLRNAS
ncbi:hypothetical protein LTR62_005414 [Meristemomyces frigidus]|uniref:Uncharacterized protein n=1 Tax=Meristemomyces frigidus TaxID=1508187 RepID=A0AAN7TL32_9PEZI|nr:hypothetical protein LTR62_005414 [Meristemomyces frigidus]